MLTFSIPKTLTTISTNTTQQSSRLQNLTFPISSRLLAGVSRASNVTGGGAPTEKPKLVVSIRLNNLGSF